MSKNDVRAVSLLRYEKSDNVNLRYQNTAIGDTKSPILSDIRYGAWLQGEVCWGRGVKKKSVPFWGYTLAIKNRYLKSQSFERP